MKELLRQKIAGYSDSLQAKVEMETRDVGFGVKVDLPRLYQRTLAHELFFVVAGPDDGEGAVKQCLARAAVSGAIAGIAVAYTGVGAGAAIAAAEAAASNAFKECAGNQFDVRFDDTSTWGKWHPV